MKPPSTVTRYPMKNCPRSARCGPTTGPPLRTSQRVATKRTSPPTRPSTMPCTVALSRTIRATRRLSIVRGSSIPISIGRVLDELEEAAQQAALDAPARQRHVEEEGRVPEEREAPPDHAAHEGAVQQPHQRPRRRHSVAGEILAEQAEGGPDHRPALDDERHGREEERQAGRGADRARERDAVQAREELGDVRLEDLLGDLLVVLGLGVDLPEVVPLVEDQVPDREHAG